MRNKKLMEGITAILMAAMAVSSASKAATVKLKRSVSDCIISKGDKIDINVTGANETKGKYKVLNSKIVAVSKKGIVTTKDTGKTKIIWKKGKKKYNCSIKVVKAPAVDKTNVTIVKNAMKKVSVLKYGNSNLKVKWKSENTEIAKVSGGKITGVAKGKTAVIVKIYGNEKVFKRIVKVTVTEDENKTIFEEKKTNTEDKITENTDNTTEKPNLDKPTDLIPEQNNALTDNKTENSNLNNVVYPNINIGNNTGNKPEKPEEVTTPGGIEPEKPGEVTTPGGIELEKDQHDIDALQSIIKEQIANGAEVSEDLDDEEQYFWNDEGRLTEIYWSGTGLSGEIDFSGLPELQNLNCSSNELTGLDVSGNANLTVLDCSSNKITELDMSGNENLTELDCSSNAITMLDLGANGNLESLNCLENELRELDLSNNPYLKEDNVSYDDEVEVFWCEETGDEEMENTEEDSDKAENKL